MKQRNPAGEGNIFTTLADLLDAVVSGAIKRLGI